MAFLKEEKKAKGDLVQIENADLAQALRDRQLLKAELKTLSNDPDKESDENPVGALQIVEQKIRELQRGPDGQRVEKAFVIGFGKSYLTPTVWSGVDVQKLKAEHPAIYEQVFVKKATGSETLRVYPAKGA